jgi:hypothetical protein
MANISQEASRRTTYRGVSAKRKEFCLLPDRTRQREREREKERERESEREKESVCVCELSAEKPAGCLPRACVERTEASAQRSQFAILCKVNMRVA